MKKALQVNFLLKCFFFFKKRSSFLGGNCQGLFTFITIFQEEKKNEDLLYFISDFNLIEKIDFRPKDFWCQLPNLVSIGE